MNGSWRGWRNRMLGVIALAICAALPAAACAEDLYFRNDSAVAVIVQGSCIVRGGKVVNSRPSLVLPGKWTSVSLPGNKVITVREPRAPNRILLQDKVAGAAEDKFILISPDPVAGLKFEATTKKEFQNPKKP